MAIREYTIVTKAQLTSVVTLDEDKGLELGTKEKIANNIKYELEHSIDEPYDDVLILGLKIFERDLG